mmetsp:Transcript_21224/g.47894  ORF Transcript_21224/g.47894 Transcript_21224/m.47894 type:complete len:382 (-) Transcript_21224:29-1174(-)
MSKCPQCRSLARTGTRPAVTTACRCSGGPAQRLETTHVASLVSPLSELTSQLERILASAAIKAGKARTAVAYSALMLTRFPRVRRLGVASGVSACDLSSAVARAAATPRCMSCAAAWSSRAVRKHSTQAHSALTVGSWWQAASSSKTGTGRPWSSRDARGRDPGRHRFATAHAAVLKTERLEAPPPERWVPEPRMRARGRSAPAAATAHRRSSRSAAMLPRTQHACSASRGFPLPKKATSAGSAQRADSASAVSSAAMLVRHRSESNCTSSLVASRSSAKTATAPDSTTSLVGGFVGWASATAKDRKAGSRIAASAGREVITATAESAAGRTSSSDPAWPSSAEGTARRRFATWHRTSGIDSRSEGGRQARPSAGRRVLDN